MKISEDNSHSLKCVWMSAGLVNYKLCDKYFQCEECEFYHAMRGILPATIPQVNHPAMPETKNHDRPVEPSPNPYLLQLLEGCCVHLDRYYLSHFWFKIENREKSQMGIDPLSLKVLYPLERIILPDIGEVLQKNQLMAWLVRGNTTIPLYSPVNCKIIELNPLFLAGGLETVQQSDSYLMRIMGQNLEQEIKNMCCTTSGIGNYTTKMANIQSYLSRAMDSQLSRSLGPTLCDGGRIESNLENIIGTVLFQEFIKSLFYKK